tara:strand:+ start:7229 stop:8449 length:1221 start_codon:yes stop_codon:yes gene_type:complete
MTFRALLTIGILSAVLSEAHGEVDRVGMQRDIRIMERVLDELLTDERDAGAGISVNGLYFDGYGALFLVEQSRVVVRIRRGNQTSTVDGEGDVGTARLKEQLITFYEDYAQNLRLLPDDERVTVRVRGRGSHGPSYTTLGRMSEEDVEHMLAARMRSLEGEMEAVQHGMEAFEKEMEEQDDDSVSVRRYGFDPVRVQAQIEQATRRVQKAAVRIAPGMGRSVKVLEASATRAQIVRGDEVSFKTFDGEDASEKSIRIFAGILHSTMSDRAFVRSRGHAIGFYQPGLGAVLFLEGSPKGGYGHAVDYYRTALDVNRRDPTPTEDVVAEQVKQFTQDLVSLIGDYGGTLKPVKASESIVVRVDFGHWGRLKGRPSALLLQLAKKNVERYGKGRLDLEGLVKTAAIEEF